MEPTRGTTKDVVERHPYKLLRETKGRAAKNHEHEEGTSGRKKKEGVPTIGVLTRYICCSMLMILF
jgi:hypothetical protein